MIKKPTSMKNGWIKIAFQHFYLGWLKICNGQGKCIIFGKSQGKVREFYVTNSVRTMGDYPNNRANQRR